MIILFPLLKPFADFLDRGKGRDLAFLCISLLLFLLNDLMENRLLFFGFTPLTGFLPAAAEILWGHILCRRVRTGRILAPVLLFFTLNLARTFAQLRLYSIGSDHNLRVWYSVFGILCGACILCCGLLASGRFSGEGQPDKNAEHNQRLSEVLCAAASYTFGIYLLHPLLAGAATALNLWDILQERLSARLPYPIGSLLFLLIGTGGVFFASLLACILLRSVKKRVLLIMERLPHRGQP